MNQSKSMSIVSGHNSHRKSGWLLILKLCLSVGLIVVVLSFVDLRELINVVFNINPLYLVAFVALIHLDRALMAYKEGVTPEKERVMGTVQKACQKTPKNIYKLIQDTLILY